jgi:hypothetical protein
MITPATNIEVMTLLGKLLVTEEQQTLQKQTHTISISELWKVIIAFAFRNSLSSQWKMPLLEFNCSPFSKIPIVMTVTTGAEKTSLTVLLQRETFTKTMKSSFLTMTTFPQDQSKLVKLINLLMGKVKF